MRLPVLLLGLLSLTLLTFVPFTYISKDVKPQYDDVMTIVKAQCNEKEYNHPPQILVRLANLPYPELGVCSFEPGGFTILFDKSYWNKSDPDMKFELMCHELTHCLFNLGHVDNPYNYMYMGLNERNVLSRDETIVQFNEVLKDKCSKH